MACIPPNPKRVGYIDHLHRPLDGPLYMRSHIHQQNANKSLTSLQESELSVAATAHQQCASQGKCFKFFFFADSA